MELKLKLYRCHCAHEDEGRCGENACGYVYMQHEVDELLKHVYTGSPTHFAFLVKRPIDSQAWPLIFTDPVRAREYPHRVSDVVPLQLSPGATVVTAIDGEPARSG